MICSASSTAPFQPDRLSRIRHAQRDQPGGLPDAGGHGIRAAVVHRYTQAAEQGHEGALNNLGIMHEVGSAPGGVDMDQAFDCLTKAAELGSVEVCGCCPAVVGTTAPPQPQTAANRNRHGNGKRQTANGNGGVFCLS